MEARPVPTGIRASLLTARPASWALVFGFLLVLLWPGQASSITVTGALNVRDYGAKADGVTDDTAAIQACIEAAADAGKICYLPAGTYVTSILMVPDNVKISGDGTATTLRTSYRRGGGGSLFYCVNSSGVVITDMQILGASTGTMQSGDNAVIFGNSHNCSVERVTFNYWSFAVRVGADGSPRGNSSISIKHCISLSGNHTFLLGAYVNGLQLSGCDLSSYNGNGSGTSHQIYLPTTVADVTISDTTLRGGSGYALQIYPGPSLMSIALRNVTMVDVLAGVILDTASNVTISGFVGSSNRYYPGAPWFALSQAQNVLVENFTVSNGSSLVQASDSSAAFRNGTYQGGSLGSGVTFENVNSATTITTATPTTSATNTTVAPTTTTTRPPLSTTTTTGTQTTTNTTVAPTTTTTRPPLSTTTTAGTQTTTGSTAAPTTTVTTRPPLSTTTTAGTQTTTGSTAAPTTTVTTRPPPSTTTTTGTQTTITRNVPGTTTATPSETPSIAESAAVAITSPLEQSTVQGKVKVGLTANSRVPVAKVRLYVDSRFLGQDYRAPYSFTWSTRWTAPGSTHTITGIAYDRVGREIGRASCQVTIAASAPSVKAEAATPSPTASAYLDVGPASAYSAAASMLAEAGVMSGFSDGRLAPQQETTRAQFAKMVSIALGVADEDVTLTPFRDLDEADENLYPHKFVAALHSIGVIQGTSADTFSPYAAVTRAQVATMVVRALEVLDPGALVNPADGSFSALGDIGEDHTRAMTIAEASGLLEGIEGYGPAWNAWAPATRGEVAQILINLGTLD